MLQIISNDISDLHELPVSSDKAIRLTGFLTNHYGENLDVKKVVSGGYYSEHREQFDNTVDYLKVIANDYADRNGFKVFASHNVFGDVLVQVTGFSFSKLVRAQLTDLREDEDEDAAVVIPHKGQSSSERMTIYSIARKLDMNVSVALEGKDWVVTHQTKVTTHHAKKTGGNVGIMGAIDTWLNTLEYDVASEPPLEIVQACTDSYFRTVLNKSAHTVTYRGGLVTKHSFLVRERKNQWEVLTGGQCLGTSETYDVQLFNLWLAPFGYSVEGE